MPATGFRGLLERQSVDGRSHGLALTSVGRNITAKVKKAVAAHEEDLLPKIPAAQRKSFLAALRILWLDA